MKRSLLILICLAGIINTHGQIVIEIRKDNDTSRIFTKVQVLTAFYGADSAWLSYLEKRLNASLVINNSVKKGKYTVVVKYIVAKDGAIAEVSCQNDPGYGMCQEAIIIIRKSVKSPPGEVKVRSQ